MAHKIFFDSNMLGSPESTNHFFGGRDQLSRFQKVAEIFIPSIVNSEIKRQKRRHLISKRDSFKSNPFFEKLGLGAESITDEQIDEWLNKIEAGEKIIYTKIAIRDREILPVIVEMAIGNQAPFEINSDKGFKDTLVYFTVLQYAEDNLADQIYFISQDQRLCEAFKNQKNVIVLGGYEEYQKHQESYFTGDYFIEKLKNELGDTSIASESIKKAKLGDDLIWRLTVETDSNVFSLDVDYTSREIISKKVILTP